MTYGVDDGTIYARQEEELVRRERAARFIDWLREHESASRGGRQRSEAAERSAEEFARHAAALNELVDAEIDRLVPSGPSFDVSTLTVSDEHLHVFGPGNCTLGWTHLDEGQASVDVDNAKFWAYNYTTGPARFTVAQVGVKYRPTLPVCKLSVRAVAGYSGYDILDHRVHQPDTTEQRRAWALGSLGVKVDSWALDGSGYHLEGESWADAWDRSVVNPSDSRQYDDTLSVGDGLIVEPIGVNTRDYAVWITCRVGVSADPGFEVSTYATSSISCQVIYFVVEEIEHW